MTGSREHFACDLSTARLRFRRDLAVTTSDDARRPHVIIEDPVSGAYYRLGKMEYALACLLCDDRNIAEAYATLCEQFPDQPLSESDAGDLCRWLVSSELAHTDSSQSASRLHQSAKQYRGQQLRQRANPIAIQVPILHPDRLVSRIQPWIGWLFSPWASALVCLLMFVCGWLVLANWNALNRSSESLFSPSSMLFLACVTIGLKVVHEFAHALVCKRYGVNVGEMGVLFILFAPLAYVDVSSVWRLRSRWQRIHVAVAGIYIEMLVAALAMLIWMFSQSPLVQHACVGVMLSVGLATLVFNANPLMKFDGYFVMTDWARMPNLYVDSQQFLSNSLRRCFLGDAICYPNWSNRYRLVVAIYGVLALIWKAVVCVGLVAAAAKLFHGLGTVLAIAAAACWIGVPLWQGLKRLRSATNLARLRFALISVASAVMISAVMFGCPWPRWGSTPAVVEYAPHEIIRAKVAGMVERIDVVPGQQVSPGDVLIQLRNRELANKTADLEFQIAQSQVRQRQLLRQGKRAGAQGESSKSAALEKQLGEMQLQVDALTIRASGPGVIVCRGLLHRLGTYVQQGDEILVIGQESQKELRLMISQTEYDRFRDHLQQPIRYRAAGIPTQSSTLKSIIPRATTQTIHPALLTNNGGPLAVKPVALNADRPRGTANQTEFELLAPHFQGIVPLGPHQSAQLRSGQRASVSLGLGSESIASHLYHSVGSWGE
ncbi:site-2 protease family protein [Stieleria sp. TO1_6]|uniref:site-2 protease family protein n=1 Tax=Stieleria tagensis TaxID=2956795 RepID=UPI00209BA63B|nr:site-2 protease family protein [Stieleria tagensis]MCO8121375.1 site-2 protease family protein [Stieleria tagensis]